MHFTNLIHVILVFVFVFNAHLNALFIIANQHLTYHFFLLIIFYFLFLIFVFSIDGVDEENEIIYFSGNKGNHTQRHLFMTSFSSDNPTPGKLIKID